MLTRPEIAPATLAAARAVGLSPSALARRCVSIALRRAGARLASFLSAGVYTDARSAGAPTAASSNNSPVYTPKQEARA